MRFGPWLWLGSVRWSCSIRLPRARHGDHAKNSSRAFWKECGERFYAWIDRRELTGGGRRLRSKHRTSWRTSFCPGSTAKVTHTRFGGAWITTCENSRTTNSAAGSNCLALVASGIAGLLFRSSVIEITGKSRHSTHTSAMQADNSPRSLRSVTRHKKKPRNAAERTTQPRFNASSNVKTYSARKCFRQFLDLRCA